MSPADGVGSHSHHRSSLCFFLFLFALYIFFLTPRWRSFVSSYRRLMTLGVEAFIALRRRLLFFRPFYPRWGYWLRVVVLSAWLSRMRSRVDRLMLSEIETKTWKTNEMVVLDFFNPMFGGLMALMRYRYWSFESSPKMSLNLVGFRWNTVWFRQWRRDRDMMTCVFLAVED